MSTEQKQQEQGTVREPSMLRQKAMTEGHYKRLAQAKETGKKVVYTFVPGNLTELLLAFDVLPVLPEINALQSGMRKRSGKYIAEAERQGHSEDVCTYVKCDIGMLLEGNVGPTGEPLPEPDLLLLSYTGCFTFLKWFELLRERYDCPVAMLHVPYQSQGEIEPGMVEYVVEQIQTEVIPKLEEITGLKYDEDRVRELLGHSAKAEDDLVAVLESAKHRPSPIDSYFGGVYYIGPLFTAFRGTVEAVDYYAQLRRETEERVSRGLGPITPAGEMSEERFRLVVEGPPNWTHFHQFWSMFHEQGAVVVASTYTKVGGLYDRGFRHDPSRPLETLAEYCLGCYTNLSLPARVDMINDYVNDYEADGFLINSVKSCNSFSAGQLVMLREVEERCGKPGAFIETDLVDPRYFSASNVKNRIESYFQMLDQRRAAEAGEASPDRAPEEVMPS
ncbi:MAG: benzoyl-CoA reductase subunit B [Planctomycetota bacterium]|jgi:benzoyl-CoA reductase subunit B|nr:benzoyl-CoA reductase subunit B [Planctomycetota bacterium]MDP6738904.1 benzoyl-CoA reductase subunit B [Planctomycetota bacterium]MDP6937210.1 benzoyl-CoA reductase subunit B [Planctomycetota bacterium]